MHIYSIKRLYIHLIQASEKFKLKYKRIKSLSGSQKDIHLVEKYVLLITHIAAKVQSFSQKIIFGYRNGSNKNCWKNYYTFVHVLGVQSKATAVTIYMYVDMVLFLDNLLQYTLIKYPFLSRTLGMALCCDLPKLKKEFPVQQHLWLSDCTNEPLSDET